MLIVIACLLWGVFRGALGLVLLWAATCATWYALPLLLPYGDWIVTTFLPSMSPADTGAAALVCGGVAFWCAVVGVGGAGLGLMRSGSLLFRGVDALGGAALGSALGVALALAFSAAIDLLPPESGLRHRLAPTTEGSHVVAFTTALHGARPWVERLWRGALDESPASPIGAPSPDL